MGRRFREVRGEVVELIARAVLGRTEDIANEVLKAGLAPSSFALVGFANVVRCGSSTSINLDGRFIAPNTPAIVIVIPLAPGVIK